MLPASLAALRLPGWVRPMLRRLGFDLVRFLPFAHPLARRAHMLQVAGVDVVLDVGANVGQYAKELRELGYRGRIVSFEPVSAAFAALSRAAAADGAWDCVNLALGHQPGNGTINVSANTESSSLLPIRPEHVRSAPGAAYVGKEEISIQTLAWALRTYAAGARRPYVKIDAQGVERAILEGAETELDRVAGVQLELSLAPMYEGGCLIDEMIPFMTAKGFVLVGLEPAYSDPRSGRLLQVDGIFFRESALASGDEVGDRPGGSPSA